MLKTDINFVNLQNDTVFSLDSKQKITPDTKINPKKATIASRLCFNDIVTHSFKLEKKYSPSELAIAVELKMYEDLGLDIQKEYKISHIQKHTDIENILLIEAFAFDKKNVQQKYAQTLKNIKYLDFLVIPPLVFETLYVNDKIEKGNDVFVYIAENEAFLTFYKDGTYLSSKKIKSLNEMIKDLESKNIRITLDDLKEILAKKGVDKEKYTLLEYEIYDYVSTTFEKIFSTIKNLALHNRNIYNFTKLDNIYVKVANASVVNLYTLIQEHIEGVKLYPLNLFKEYENLDFIDILSAYFVQDKIKIDDNTLNATFYKKKIPFLKTEVGKFSIVASFSMLLILSYPIYNQIKLTKLNQANQKLQERILQLSQSTKILQKKHKKIKRQIASLKKQKNDISKKFVKLQNITDTLLSLKSQDAKYTNILLTVNSLLQKYALSVDKVIQSAEKSLDLELYSTKNRRDTIALFMKDLLALGYTKVYSNEIKLDDDNYKSIITIKR